MSKEIVTLAHALAVVAHKGQYRKGTGEPYINHVERVAGCLYGWRAKTIAFLHDVIEDSDWTAEDIYNELYKVDPSENLIIEYIVEAVEAITKVDGEEYSNYLKRVKTNCFARQVKLADLRHNSDLRRLPGVKQKDIERLKKYSEAYIYLMEE